MDKYKDSSSVSTDDVSSVDKNLPGYLYSPSSREVLSTDDFSESPDFDISKYKSLDISDNTRLVLSTKQIDLIKIQGLIPILYTGFIKKIILSHIQKGQYNLVEIDTKRTIATSLFADNKISFTFDEPLLVCPAVFAIIIPKKNQGCDRCINIEYINSMGVSVTDKWFQNDNAVYSILLNNIQYRFDFETDTGHSKGNEDVKMYTLAKEISSKKVGDRYFSFHLKDTQLLTKNSVTSLLPDELQRNTINASKVSSIIAISFNCEIKNALARYYKCVYGVFDDEIYY